MEETNGQFTLVEKVKSFLGVKKAQQLSSEVSPLKIRVADDDTEFSPFINGFFDGSGGTSLFATQDRSTVLERQKIKILNYRSLAKQPEVDSALEEIMNEIVFSTDALAPISVSIDEENEKIKDAIEKSFKKIYKLINVERNFYSIVRNAYVDGQTIALLQYDKNSTKNGIQKIKFIDPVYFYFDAIKNEYYYMKRSEGNFMQQEIYTQSEESFSIEEIVHENFGQYSDGLIESHLEKAIKPANQLKTLEDLLIPMRFSRSMSRRVFNVDIGDISPKSGDAVLNGYQQKFKYKKFYNVETGEVTNQQHITSMVEDYWFANRSGGKGTTVDTIDETGNLGELGDIIYFYKKLYKALNIPSNRVPYQTDQDTSFDYSATNVSKEDMKFFMFVSRLRGTVSSLFKRILERELVASGILSSNEWEDFEEKIKIVFSNENKFIEKMKLDQLTTQLDLYATARDYAGNVFSYSRLMQRVFGMSEIEIEENLKEIEKEKKNKLFAGFYKQPEEEDM
jgi:hypothetical protein